MKTMYVICRDTKKLVKAYDVKDDVKGKPKYGADGDCFSFTDEVELLAGCDNVKTKDLLAALKAGGVKVPKSWITIGKGKLAPKILEKLEQTDLAHLAVEKQQTKNKTGRKGTRAQSFRECLRNGMGKDETLAAVRREHPDRRVRDRDFAWYKRKHDRGEL